MSDVKKEDIDELISILAPLATGQASPAPGWVGGADRYKPPKGLLPEVASKVQRDIDAYLALGKKLGR